jgi:hypothetical protein
LARPPCLACLPAPPPACFAFAPAPASPARPPHRQRLSPARRPTRADDEWCPPSPRRLPAALFRHLPIRSICGFPRASDRRTPSRFPLHPFSRLACDRRRPCRRRILGRASATVRTQLASHETVGRSLGREDAGKVHAHGNPPDERASTGWRLQDEGDGCERASTPW